MENYGLFLSIAASELTAVNIELAHDTVLN